MLLFGELVAALDFVFSLFHWSCHLSDIFSLFLILLTNVTNVTILTKLPGSFPEKIYFGRGVWGVDKIAIAWGRL